MKAHEKKKAYRLECHREMLQGFINDAATGRWIKPANVDGTTARNVYHGNHPK